MDATGGEFWHTSGRPGDDQPGQWQQMLSATHLPWAVKVAERPAGPAFRAWIRRRWLDDLALVECECGPCSGVRQRSQLASTDGEFVILLINRAGRETVSQDGADGNLRPGDAVTWVSGRPARFAVWEPLAKRSLLIPRTALDEVGGAAWLRAGTVLCGSAPAVKLLVSYLDTVSQALPRLGPAGVLAARNAALELLAGAIRPDTGVASTPDATLALRMAMSRYIERHLPGPAVTPAAIAAAHGVSVRTVNRVFSAAGLTVGEFVRDRRLARARGEVAAGLDPISAIAHRWGFADSSHFTRSFKARYGASPREYRAAARAGAGGQDPVAAIQSPGSGAAETGSTAGPG